MGQHVAFVSLLRAATSISARSLEVQPCNSDNMNLEDDQRVSFCSCALW